MKLCLLSLGVLLSAAIACVQGQKASFASPRADLAEIARNTTVFIQAAGRPDVFGSGVIVNRSGKTYTAIVAKHVVVLTDSYRLTTVDQQKHVIKAIEKLEPIDLAIVRFEASKAYQVAEADNGVVRQLEMLYVSGYPKPTASVASYEHTLVPATINAILTPERALEGYSLRYSATLREGMSGGPVFNEQGDVVAIHGRADQLGGLGIPLKTLIEKAKVARLKLELNVASAPTTPPASKKTPVPPPPPAVFKTAPSAEPRVVTPLPVDIPGYMPSRPGVIMPSAPSSGKVCSGNQCY
jgi:hypothetical protein